MFLLSTAKGLALDEDQTNKRYLWVGGEHCYCFLKFRFYVFRVFGAEISPSRHDEMQWGWRRVKFTFSVASAAGQFVTRQNNCALTAKAEIIISHPFLESEVLYSLFFAMKTRNDGNRPGLPFLLCSTPEGVKLTGNSKKNVFVPNMSALYLRTLSPMSSSWEEGRAQEPRRTSWAPRS